MKKCNFYQALLFVVLNSFTLTSLAWNHSIELGYGHSQDPNHTRYHNSGFLLTSDLFPLRRTPCTFWSVTGALGHWYATTPHNKHLTTGALSLALRYYPFKAITNDPFYLLGSAGPAYLSTRKFGRNTQAKNVTGQFNLGLGVELNQFDINLRISHFSNMYLARPDQGFSVLYLLSLGYLF